MPTKGKDGQAKEATDKVIQAACRMLCPACIGRPEGCGADPLVCLKGAGLSGLVALELAEAATKERLEGGNAVKEEEES